MSDTMPRRVLIVHPYGIGDLLFATPVFRALRLIPTVERVDLVLGSRTDAVVKHNPHIDKIYIVNKDRFHRQTAWATFQEVRSLGRELADQHYDLLLDFSLRAEYAFFAQFFLGIPRRAGFAYKDRGFFHNIRVPLPQGFAAKHAADFACDVAEAAGVPVKDRYFEFYPQPQDREAAAALLQKFPKPVSRYLVVSPGGGESWGKDAHFKRWPAKFFSDFINRLQPSLDFEGVFMLGSGGEKDLAEEAARGVQVPVLNLAGEISLETAAALIEGAEVFLGNDGGLVHLASALHRPVIAFYGPVDPAVYGPYPERPRAIAIYKDGLECRPCYQKFRYRSDCATRECLQQLTPVEAMEFLTRRGFLSTLQPSLSK